ncbi:hypothetical protein Tco_0699886 [Tanacetum coccineum]
MIRLHALHRRSAGTNALVVLRDTRWEDSRQIYCNHGRYDLSAGTQLVIHSPDMILSVKDLPQSYKKCYYRLMGRLSNTSYMGFQYSVENVVDHLTTTGITAIPGERRSIEELEGMSWHLKPPEKTLYRTNTSYHLVITQLINHDSRSIGNDILDKDEENSSGICLQSSTKKKISLMMYVSVSCLNEANDSRRRTLHKVRRLPTNQDDHKDKGQVKELWSYLHDEVTQEGNYLEEGSDWDDASNETRDWDG